MVVVNHEIIKSIGILISVVHPMIEIDVDKPHDCFQQGSELDAGNLLAAFDTLCIGFGPRTSISTLSAAGTRYLLSARRQ